MASAFMTSTPQYRGGIQHHDETEDELDGSWSDAHANFLSSLSDLETDSLLRVARKKSLAPKDLLFRAGDQSSDFYVVAEGSVRLFQVAPDGKEMILWLSFPGEIFGIAELLSGSNREIYAEANENAVVYAVKREDFARFIGDHPEAAMRAIGILSARVRSLGHALVGLATDNVETRIARLLMQFAQVASNASSPRTDQNGELRVNVPLTHQDIANLIGASRQTVTTTLAELRKAGVLRSVERYIHIVDRKRLGQILDQGGS